MKKILVIGAADEKSSIAQALAASGHQVILADPWSPEPSTLSGVAGVMSFDLGNRDAVFDLFDRAATALDGLDTLVFAAANDAAFSLNDGRKRQGISNEEWRRSVNHLLYGGFYSTQAALRRMIAQRSGSIVYLCADLAVDGNIREPSIAAISCGLLAMSSSLAASAFRHGVTMNALILGMPFPAIDKFPVLPEESAEGELAYAPKAAFAAMRERTLHLLNKRADIGWHESVAAMVSHLSSDEGGLISGSTLRLPNVGKLPPLIRWSY